jgi:hypothetical protein
MAIGPQLRDQIGSLGAECFRPAICRSIHGIAQAYGRAVFFLNEHPKQDTPTIIVFKRFLKAIHVLVRNILIEARQGFHFPPVSSRHTGIRRVISDHR